MNREQARKNWEVIKAYGEGKELQYRKIGETEWHDERKHLGFCFDTDDCEFRIKPEENYTIVQNAGENRIEGGVLSVSGSVSEKHYKPFEDTAELMLHYSKHFNIDFPPFYEPIIWVKNKSNDTRYLIIGFEESRVLIGNSWFTMKDLFRQCVFLDGSPIGQEE